jgi:hypothetical protein
MQIRGLNHALAVGANRAATTRMPSRAIWATCPVAELLTGTKDGFFYWNDFERGYALAANQAATSLGDGVVGLTDGTAGSTIGTLTDEPTGVIQLATTTNDEDVGISILGAVNTAGQIVFGSGKRVWMEARLKVGPDTAGKDDACVFVGFAEEGLLTNAGVISTSDALADKDAIGFLHQIADEKFDAIHNTASGGGVTTVEADVHATTADTYVKLGLYCDGTTIRYYVDGTEVCSTLVSATNVPDGEEMAFYLNLMSSGGADSVCEVDWVRIAQERAFADEVG